MEETITLIHCIARHSTGVTSPAVTPSSDSNHRIPEFEGGEIENNPEVRHDVAREADRNEQEELPERGTRLLHYYL